MIIIISDRGRENKEGSECTRHTGLCETSETREETGFDIVIKRHSLTFDDFWFSVYQKQQQQPLTSYSCSLSRLLNTTTRLWLLSLSFFQPCNKRGTWCCRKTHSESWKTRSETRSEQSWQNCRKISQGIFQWKLTESFHSFLSSLRSATSTYDATPASLLTVQDRSTSDSCDQT
jgi:hypothetical protein